MIFNCLFTLPDKVTYLLQVLYEVVPNSEKVE